MFDQDKEFQGFRDYTHTDDRSYDSYDSYGYRKEDKHKEKKSSGVFQKIVLTIVLALVFGVVAGAAFQIVDFAGDKIRAHITADDPIVSDESEIDEMLGSALQKDSKNKETVTTVYDVSEVADETMPSLVSITNQSVQEIQSFFGTYRQPSESSGTGIIVGKNDTELLIATNNHVVQGSEQLNVCFIDNQVSNAYVKGTDPSNDLAVIAVSLPDIPAETMREISIAQLGDSDTLKIGEPVIAIGNALGYGQSVTTGVISALNREVTIENTTNSLIQTDAAINPGNSGGALLNMKGQVIGINSAKLASSQIEGMGYAIPISTAKPIIDNLMNRETRQKVEDEAQRGYLGISGMDVTASISEQMGMPQGAFVASVVDGAAAQEAGLQKGDIIVEFDGVSINSMTYLKDLMSYYKKGETVEVTFYRADDGNYVEKNTEITLSDYSKIQTE